MCIRFPDRRYRGRICAHIDASTSKALPEITTRLEKTLTTKYRGTHLVDGAGHWVQQEQPEVLSKLLLEFLKGAGT